jgi:hypothetical protein
MKQYGRHLVYSTFAAFAGLPVGCLIVGIAMGISGLLSGSESLGDIQQLLFFTMSVAFVAMVVGALPALLYGVPLYAWLSFRGWANVFTALGVGLLPGLAMMPFETDIAYFTLIFGPTVALCTHLLARRRLAKLRAPGKEDASLATAARDPT